MFAQATASPSAIAADARRLRAMVDAYWVPVGRITRTLGVPEAEIEDALQAVFLVAAQKLDAIEHGKERAFLIQTAVHVAARVRRRRGRSREDVDDRVPEVSDPAARSAEDTLDRERAMRLLGRALDALDDDVREVFVLHEVEEMTMAEIANVLDLAPGTVASRLRRAREQFERQVARLRRDPKGASR